MNVRPSPGMDVGTLYFLIRCMPDRETRQEYEEALLEGQRRGNPGEYLASWIRGRIEQCIANLLAVLEARQIPLPDAERKRITSCRDSAALDRWFRRALTATTLDEVFAEEDEAAADRVAGG